MSSQGNEELIILNRKLDELLDRYNSIRTELIEIRNRNEVLSGMLHEREEKTKELEIKYERVKLTGALLGEGDNTLEARKKITELVREVDKCVALLNR